MLGELIGQRFRAQERVGSGGMGTIYRAVDERSGERVALKVLHGQEDGAPQRFEREMEALSRLAHPRVVRYVASGQSDRGPFLVMQWIEGEDLAKRVRGGPLSVAEVLRLGIGLADPLCAVHAAGMVHRDLKPANVFFSGDEPTLVDFGLAKLDESEAVSATGLMVGTPGYMAPEQARGQRDLDGRVDVFALGCVLFRCLTGQGPFAAPDAMATLAKILFDEPRAIQELRADVPTPLARAIMEMLTKDRTGRPTAAEVLVALRAISVGDAPAPSVDVEPTLALTERERRVVTVVVAAHSDLGDAEATISRAPAVRFAGALSGLRAVADRAGAKLELLGGGVVATLFGRGAATDQAARASRLALAMQTLLGEVPIAVATGHAEVGARVVGDVIDRAVADAAALAGEAGVWVDATTAGLLGPEFEQKRSGARTRVTGESKQPAAFVRTLLGKPTPCVGRDRELAALDALYDEVETESVPRVAVVTAAAGVGKSRVRHEWVLRLGAREAPPRVWISRADSMSTNAPFGMVRQWIVAAAGLRPDDAPEQARAKLRARVEAVVAEDASRVGDFLGEMLGLAFADDGRVQLRSARRDAVLLGDQMRRAFEDWLTGEVARGPLVLVLEDLHWGDAPSLKLIDGICRGLADSPLMVVAFARPELDAVAPKLWAQQAGAQRISLAELSAKASQRLLRSVLGDDLDDAAVARIVAQSAGNPFFLEEMVRAHAEGRAEDSPDTVRAVVQRRLEGLDSDARRVLRAASVFGQTFWAAGVLALLGGETNPMSQIESRLDALLAAELVSRRPASRLAKQHEFTFRHAIVRDAAYDMLTADDRTLGHRLAGGWLERAGERNAALLAEHYDRGATPARACGYYVRATTQALEGGDLPGVVELGERAVRTGATGTELGEVRRAQAESLRWQGKLEAAERAAAESVELLSAGSSAWYSAVSELATALVGQGKPESIEAIRDALVERKGATDAGEPRIIALARVAGQAFATGKRAVADGLVAAAEAVPDVRDPIARARLEAARAYRAPYASDPGPYYDHITAARELYESAGDLRNACVQATNQGFIAMSLGAFDVAERAMLSGRHMATQMSLARIAALADQNLGFIRLEQGRVDESVTLQRTALAALLAQNDRRLATHSRLYLSWALRERGELDEALREATVAEETCVAMPPVHVIALTTLADLALSRGEVAHAKALAAAAHEKIEALGGVEDGESYVRVVHAEVLHASGDVAGAKAAIARELGRLAEREAKIARPEWRETFRTNVRSNARVHARAAEWGV